MAAPALTRRNEGVLDCIARDDVAPDAVSNVAQKVKIGHFGHVGFRQLYKFIVAL